MLRSPLPRLTTIGLATLSAAGVLALSAAPVLAAAPEAPIVTSESTSAVTQTSATLNATLDLDVETTYHFEYGTSAAYGTSVPVPDAAVTGEGPIVVGQELTGLQPGTTYHYRVIASNPLGQAVGGDQTFTTPPLKPSVVSTGQASGVAQNSATLTATIDTQGFETTYEFDLGTDTSYGTRIFGDAGVEPGAQTFTVSPQGLAPGTTYHYRIVATNTFGTSYGADQTFTTSTFPTALVLAPVTTPLIATQPVTFPVEVETPTTTKALTRGQKLADALKACGKKPKKQRATCEKQVRKLYGLAQKKASRASEGNHRNDANRRAK